MKEEGDLRVALDILAIEVGKTKELHELAERPGWGPKTLFLLGYPVAT